MRQEMDRIIYKNKPDKTTPLSAGNLNFSDNKATIIQECLIVTEEISQNINFTIPVNYKVKEGLLDVYYEGCKLVLGEHYIEIGEEGSISNVIQLKDWSCSSGIFDFIVRGVYTNE